MCQAGAAHQGWGEGKDAATHCSPGTPSWWVGIGTSLQTTDDRAMTDVSRLGEGGIFKIERSGKGSEACPE